MHHALILRGHRPAEYPFKQQENQAAAVQSGQGQQVEYADVDRCLLYTSQSMLNTPAHDIPASVEQARRLQAAGCDIIRAAVPDREAVPLIAALKEAVSIPVVADIHFDYRLALEAAAAGVDKIRINPGNIGDESRVKAVADACRQRRIPIRIGVNAGSLEKEILAKYGHPTAEAMRDA